MPRRRVAEGDSENGVLSQKGGPGGVHPSYRIAHRVVIGSDWIAILISSAHESLGGPRGIKYNSKADPLLRR